MPLFTKYIESRNFSSRVSPQALRKLFKIGVQSAKDERKDVLIFRESALAPPKPSVLKVVLYHTGASGRRHLRRCVWVNYDF